MSDTKTCSRCKEEKGKSLFSPNRKAKDGLASWCKPCVALRSKEYFNNPENRAKHRLICRRYNKTRNRNRDTAIYKSRYPEKFSAVQKVGQAIWHGRMTRPTVCSECGQPGTIQAHHDDYSKPYEVRWVCHLCHTKIHHNKQKGA